MQSPMKLVEAGPGAGKTRYLVNVINDHINNGVSPYDIVPITYSRQGAMEITRRTQGEVTGQTNHGYCLGIIKLACKLRGSQPPHVANEDEIKRLMERAIEETGVSQIISIGDAMKAYSTISNTVTELSSMMPEMQMVILRFKEILNSEGLLDFAGILTEALKELQDPAVQSYYSGRHILLDEGQDISPTGEWPVIEELIKTANSLIMFASPSQQIYGFRGANWSELEKLFPSDYQTERMLKNHRSTPEIIACSSVLAGDDAKGMIPMRASIGSPVRWVDAVSDDMEYDFIAHQIAAWRNMPDPVPWDQIAILTRLHRQTGPIERVLRSRDIPISIVGSKKSFFESQEAQALLGYIRLALNLMDDSVLESIIDYPPAGIGTRRRFQIRKDDKMNWDHLVDVLYDKDNHPDYVIDRIQEITYLRDDLRILMSNPTIKTTSDKLNEIVKISGITDYLASDGDRSGIQMMDGLIMESAKIGSLNEFADYLSDEIKRPRAASGVQLSTLHSSKGREWSAVIMPGMQNGILPHENADEKEERNLAFVGMTRAMDHLVMTSSRETKLSPFLEGTWQKEEVWPTNR